MIGVAGEDKSDESRPPASDIQNQGWGYTPWRKTNPSHNVTPENERQPAHLLFPPILASAIWIGGGSVGLLLCIVIAVLLLRQGK